MPGGLLPLTILVVVHQQDEPRDVGQYRNDTEGGVFPPTSGVAVSVTLPLSGEPGLASAIPVALLAMTWSETTADVPVLPALSVAST